MALDMAEVVGTATLEDMKGKNVFDLVRSISKPQLANAIFSLLAQQGFPRLPSNCKTINASENTNLLIMMKAVE